MENGSKSNKSRIAVLLIIAIFTIFIVILSEAKLPLPENILIPLIFILELAFLIFRKQLTAFFSLKVGLGGLALLATFSYLAIFLIILIVAVVSPGFWADILTPTSFVFLGLWLLYLVITSLSKILIYKGTIKILGVIFVQVISVLSLSLVFYIINISVQTSLIAIPLTSIDYFELGSFALLIASIVGTSLLNRRGRMTEREKRVATFSILATLQLFFLGILSAVSLSFNSGSESSIFSLSLLLISIIDLVYAVMLLFVPKALDTQSKRGYLVLAGAFIILISILIAYGFASQTYPKFIVLPVSVNVLNCSPNGMTISIYNNDLSPITLINASITGEFIITPINSNLTGNKTLFYTNETIVGFPLPECLETNKYAIDLKFAYSIQNSIGRATVISSIPLNNS